MRIVFVDPHLNTCGKNIFHFFRNDKSYSKYGYLIEFALKNNIELGFFIENNLGLSKYLFLIFIYIWCLGNGYNLFKIKIIFEKPSLKDDDILFLFIFKILDSSIIKDFKGKKIIHTTHYGLNTGKIASLLSTIYNIYFVGENNLMKNSPYFKKFFSFYKKEFYILPFTYQKRFKNTLNFKERINKSFAIGTLLKSLKDISGNESKDILDFLGHDISWHPMRKTIYENGKSNEIDCFIFNAPERDKYLLFDVVELFNKYRMFIVPEEIFDLPGIAMIEGMACGCVYIGVINEMYSDIGLEDGIHYIGYDGTLKNLIEKIQYFQQNENELEKIAQNSESFTLNNFNQEKIAKNFYNHFLFNPEN